MIATTSAILAERPRGVARIRPIEPGDQAALRAFYADLSADSRRTRFFGTSDGIGAGQSSWFCTPDHDHREGFVAIASAHDEDTCDVDRVVGHICIEDDRPGVAELAVAVSDDQRGRGIGRRLVQEAVDWARAEGLHELNATMLAGNPAIQRLLTSVALPFALRPLGAGIVEIRLDLRTTPDPA